jgi:ABC-2 type transport system ATP-binding protein
LPAIDSFTLNKAIYDIPDQQFNETLDELTELLDAKEIINQPVKTLSLGQRMKVELISSLLHRPKVLFLDEPTIGLDVVAQKTIRDFIQEYQRRHQASILLTSHYMEDVRRLCKRVLIIDQGKIIYDGDLEKLIKKYASEKTIQVVVEELPKTALLERIGHVASVDFPKITFKSKRKDLPGLMEKITKELTFVDITVEEEKIEDIIRKIFQTDRT